MNYIKFNDLVNDINSIVTQKVEITKHSGGRHVGIKFVDKPVPISINEAEYNFMHQTIVNNNLKVGYELSTGVGISTIAISQAFKFTDGHLISLDSYYEEITNVSNNIPIGNYTEDDKKQIAKLSNSYNMLQKYISNKELGKFVSIEIGWSPTDSTKLLEKRNAPLDFVFLDCPKSDKEFERDLNSIVPFLGKKYIIFVHDTHTFTNKSFELVKNVLGIDMKKVYDYFIDTPYQSRRHYALGVINNL
jgi:predicted O-methyltransferase YrrM